MSMLLKVEPELGELHEHLRKNGILSVILEQKLDFEKDYADIFSLGICNGIGNVGSLKLNNSPINYVQLLRKQEFKKCNYMMGGHLGMGIHKHSWWKLRFFLSFPQSLSLGPLNIGTVTTLKNGLFHSKVENFFWNGYAKLTTLPPGLVRDNVVDSLENDQKLRILMTKCLLKERTIKISVYSSKDSKFVKTNSRIMIESQWKLFNDLLIDAETIEMYNTIASILKNKIYEMKYHLTKK